MIKLALRQEARAESLDSQLRQSLIANGGKDAISFWVFKLTVITRLISFTIAVDDFVECDHTKLKRSRDLKENLKDGKKAQFIAYQVRPAIYRPFTKKSLFLDRVLNEEVYRQPEFFQPKGQGRKRWKIARSGQRWEARRFLSGLWPLTEFQHHYMDEKINLRVDIPTLSRWLGQKDSGALAIKTYGHLRREHSIAPAQNVSFRPAASKDSNIIPFAATA